MLNGQNPPLTYPEAAIARLERASWLATRRASPVSVMASLNGEGIPASGAG